MRVLIDTNIFIKSEDHDILEKKIQDLLELCSEINCSLVIHPKSLEDIKKDKNKKRKEISLSKLKKYKPLKSPLLYKKNQGFLDMVGEPKSKNEEVDNSLLYSTYRNAVKFFISEDRGIHKKARKLDISNKVLYIEEAINIFSNYIEKKVSRPFALKKMPVKNLETQNPFFDSLREEYPNFNNWLEKIKQEERMCWAHLSKKERLKSLLIFKKENEPIEGIKSKKEKRFKMCTFKVGREDQGKKIGELFIKLGINYALKNNLKEIYFTHYTKEGKDYLVDLVEKWGFVNEDENNGGEGVYIKNLYPKNRKLEKLPPKRVIQDNYPHFKDGKKIKKFFIPIKQKYFNRLFSHYRSRQTLLPEYYNKFIIEGNTIKKAYITHSKIKKVSPGDLVFFYCSGKVGELRCFGSVEKIICRINSVERLLEVVGKRAVYSKKELERKIRRGPVTVILFNSNEHMEKIINRDELRRMGITISQSISEIDQEKYLEIKKRGKINESFAIS